MNYFAAKLATLAPYVPGEQPQVEVIKLNTNESPYPPAPAVSEAIADATKTLARYPDPDCQKLRQALAQHFAVTPAEIFVGNGSDEVLAFCFQGLMNAGVAYPNLTYGFYPVFSQLYDIAAKEIPLAPDFKLNLADYKDETGTVIFANPNAPTSLGLPAKEIAAFVAEKPERLVIVDEAYVEFGGESMISYVKEYENLLVVGTFSKSWQLAGARLGYAVGQPALIAALNKLKFSFNPYSINTMTAAAGIAALADSAYHASCLTQIISERKKTAAALKKLGFTVLASQTNFLFVTHPKISGEVIYEKLKAQQIFVRWFNQPQIKDYIRITIGTPQQMQQCQVAIAQIIKAEV
ncbi:histidinol-phosphate transaminase [Enterococcus sp. SMC-9]|uniref:histidinol-phosphate transaminase n=1 Tax=Enterococcus sp. SMC-9 TaxID=2862343 RepID=UPI001E49422E|nr:histidinol-phosphate transaminase [Enterococcus sp. SMC-9]MCD1025438.1 histidinol-phosphate transaminase [Enterococcus sp. SMC-9]